MYKYYVLHAVPVCVCVCVHACMCVCVLDVCRYAQHLPAGLAAAQIGDCTVLCKGHLRFHDSHHQLGPEREPEDHGTGQPLLSTGFISLSDLCMIIVESRELI